MVPNITHVFRRSQNLYVNFDVYDAQPRPAELESPARQSEHEPVQRKGRQGVRDRAAG